MVRVSQAPQCSDRLYRGLGLLAVLTMWLWLLTPLELIHSGCPWRSAGVCWWAGA
ncbi:MAG: hypothetical protein VYB57_00850 [Cyanobacteriota bacterium]|nr:hypothetical protein [Cyanobacteriota bacterium]